MEPETITVADDLDVDEYVEVVVPRIATDSEDDDTWPMFYFKDDWHSEDCKHDGRSGVLIAELLGSTDGPTDAAEYWDARDGS